MKMTYLRNTVSLSIDQARCVGCEMCIAVCPHNVYAMEGRKAKIIDRDACMECGACRSNCPEDAIAVESGTGGVIPVLEEMLKTEDATSKRERGPRRTPRRSHSRPDPVAPMPPRSDRDA